MGSSLENDGCFPYGVSNIFTAVPLKMIHTVNIRLHDATERIGGIKLIRNIVFSIKNKKTLKKHKMKLKHEELSNLSPQQTKFICFQCTFSSDTSNKSKLS